MRVVMLVTNPVRSDGRVRREAQTLAREGYEVIVIGRTNGSEEEFKLDDYQVKLIPFVSGGLRSRLARKSFIVNLASELNPDIVHAHDLDTLAEGVTIARKTGAKLVYDSHELFLDSMTDSLTYSWEKKKLGKLVYLLFIKAYLSLVERLMIRRANVILTVSGSIASILKDRYRLKSKPVVIRNCQNLTDFSKTTILKNKLKVGGKTILALYQGNLMPGRGLEELVLSGHFTKDVITILMGDGEITSNLKELIAKEKLDERVVVIPAVPKDRLDQYTRSADIGIVQLIPSSLNNYLALPNKLFEYIAAGIPIVGPNFPEIKKVLVKAKGNWFNPTNPRDIGQAISILALSKVKRDKIRHSVIKIAKEEINWELESKKLLKVYRGLR